MAAAFGPRSSLRVRRRSKKFRSDFSSNFRSTTAGPEHRKQLAIQHDIHAYGEAPSDDCWQYQSIRQFSKRRSTCRRLELF